MIANSECVTQVISKKRKDKEGKSSKKVKSAKRSIEKEPEPIQVETIDNVENIDSNQAEEADTVTPTIERIAEATPESPIYIPTLSSQEPETPESCADTPIQSHANIDLVTFNSLNSNSVTKLRQERDRLEFGGLRKRHTLLHQLDRSTWPTLFMILRLHDRLQYWSPHFSFHYSCYLFTHTLQ